MSMQRCMKHDVIYETGESCLECLKEFQEPSELDRLRAEVASLTQQLAAAQLYSKGLTDAAKCLRQHLALFCGPDDAIANEIFRIADAAIAASPDLSALDEQQ